MKKPTLIFLFIVFAFASASAQFVGQGRVMSAGGNFSQYLNNTLIKNSTSDKKGAAINSFNNIENTIGARFLFDTWVAGDSVIDAQGNLVNTTSFLFNFDKMTGNLLATQDKINNMSVAPIGINSFVLTDKGKQYKFEHVKAVNPYKFFLVLVKSDTTYSLYKQFITKYIESNLRNDGVIQTGHEYNEYKDASQYFIVQESTGTSKSISLKAKAIKAALEGKEEKVDAFFREHKGVVDEKFVIDLITYLNQ